MEESKILFSKQDLKKLIIPLVLEQILAMAIGMADTVMVSSVGEAAVSGVSLVDSINILLINIFSWKISTIVLLLSAAIIRVLHFSPRA